MQKDKKIVVGICGASGVCYAIRLLEHLLSFPIDVSCIISKSGFKVLSYEEGIKEKKIEKFFTNKKSLNKKASISFYKNDDFFAPFASGTTLFDGMVVVPCSMKTLASISCGFANNLISRAADVFLKERRKLILVPRETPLNIIHIENMLKVSKAGGIIMPPYPSFYLKNKTRNDMIDGIILKIFDQLEIKHNLLKRWRE